MRYYDKVQNQLVHFDKKIINCLRLELSCLGWKTQLGYNGTVLFIYENESEIDKETVA